LSLPLYERKLSCHTRNCMTHNSDPVPSPRRVGWDNCSLLAPHTKYGIRASCILCWLMLVSAAVIYAHAEAFLRQAQHSLTFFDQLPIRVHYSTGFSLAIARSSVWLQARLNQSNVSSKIRNTTKSFVQLNMIFIHLQHSKTLEKQKNMEKLF